jgi:hypothetical protein
MRIFSLNNPDVLTSHSPSHGKLPKWYLPDERMFVKLSSRSKTSDEYMFESVSEVIASKLCEYSGFGENEYVKYELCKAAYDGGEPLTACICGSFLKRGESYIPIGEIIEPAKYAFPQTALDAKRLYAELAAILTSEYGIIGAKRTLDRIFLADGLIMNTDRHFDNFGVISTPNGFRLAPLFDCGSGFLGDKNVEYADMEYLLAELKAKPFSISFDDHLGLVSSANTADLNFSNGKIYDFINELTDESFLSAARGEKIKEILKNRLAAARNLQAQ